MSRLFEDTASSLCIESPCDAVEVIIEPREKDLGGFSVRRVLPFRNKQMVGPWIFFDHMGPAVFPAGEGLDVRPHPHINLATVTYLFEGEILHRDSIGNVQLIRPGDINLMVAGSGIVHSERTPKEFRDLEKVLHGLQLWMALPEKDEETEPDFFHYPAEMIPSIQVGEVPVRVMMGAAYGVESPVKCFSETVYLEARVTSGQQLELPKVEEKAVYVAKGCMRIADRILPEYSMAVLDSSDGVTVDAAQDSFIAVIGGRNLGKRHMYWNFVSSRIERIEKAKSDWRDGRFPLVPEEKDYIPLPD